MSNSFASLHDHCRVEKIPFASTEVSNGAQHAPEWTSTITLFDARTSAVRRFTGGAFPRKKEARVSAAEKAWEYLRREAELEVPIASTSNMPAPTSNTAG
ncbi:hypothetical protein FRB95_014426 [Tulasnella sp. JGI-2019a]|nr:hypothetical protein FRB95_014426 [Tulasnella sp. JGI-2019a]